MTWRFKNSFYATRSLVLDFYQKRKDIKGICAVKTGQKLSYIFYSSHKRTNYLVYTQEFYLFIY